MVAHHSPLSFGFSQQEQWSRLPFPNSEGLSDPRNKVTSPESPALADGFFTTEPPGRPLIEDPDNIMQDPDQTPV